ncbi:Molybdate transport system substrate-binding protein [Burkholderia sp. 8Y]|uniref:substrate-binding domain-containing protein n=1 Tax=Burkholderia sp. 8Y TaxID=2653133 RepID=UPI0012EF6055|nr:substrate-binding domain-containing protein [Burkholderia sp. 8Y]VXC90842.1 Molybdate transport system substrate-binding protein [Burkholderia sp. 8Y]
MSDKADSFCVMTSGVFTSAYLALVPLLEAMTGKRIMTLTTSIGTGETSIPCRLARSEPVDLVIVAEPNMQRFVQQGYILADTRTLIAKSSVAIAVREGEPPPDASCADALRRTLLRARTIAYSASESGKYLTTQLYQRLGIHEQCLPKSVFVGNGERTGAVVARGEADIAFQQISELRPVKGIAHITPIPPELQATVWVAAGVPVWSRNVELARSVVRFLSSADAAAAIEQSGLELIEGVPDAVPYSSPEAAIAPAEAVNVDLAVDMTTSIPKPAVL